MTDAKKIALETSLDTRPVKDGFQEIVQAAESTAAGVKNASDRAGKAVDSIGAGASGAAQKMDRETKRISDSIQRTVAAAEAGERGTSKYFESLARQRGANVDALRPYLQHLDAAKARQDAASASLGKMGVSAAQTAAALRGVPAQFTDIVTSIASGQQPLTVLLQQGGQLKDMFGGAGNAARALGGYVAGLVNPFTVAAGAIGAVAVAAYQGASELQAFNKTLILSGNVSGVTSDRLMGMAAGMNAVNDSITKSKAAEALNLMIDAGVRGEQQLGRYAKAAVEFEKAGGGAAAEVAKQFAALGKDPLQASLKLNESMGYLSASVSETIRSLESQGRTVEAARVAQNAYADAIENRTPQLVENIGYIESAWNGVTRAMAGAWDGLKDIGRAQSLTERYAETVGRLNAAQRSNTLGAGNGFDVTDPRTAADQRLAASLRRQIESQAVAADLTAVQAQREKERVAFLGQADKYLTSEQRQQREILAVQNLVTRQIITQEEAEKRIAAIRESNAKKPRTSRTREGDPFAADREAAKGWADAVGDFTKIAAEAEGKSLGLSKAQARLVEYLQSPAYKNASEPMRELALQQAYVAIGAEQAAEAMKMQEDQRIRSIAQENEWIKKQQEKVLAIQDQARLQREAAEEIGVEGQALINLRYERELSRAARKDEDAAILESMGFRQETINLVKAEAAAIREAAEASKAYSEKKAFNDYWQDVNRTAESVFMDIAMNGEDAFKRIGESIKREILQMLYEMTVKKWIIQIAGSYGGVGGSGGNLLMSAAQSYMTGGSAWGASANAAGAWATGSMSTANAYGSIYANATGTGMNGLLATNGAYGTASGSAAGASSASWISAVGYVALIAAAVMVAQNLYAKGYTRAALGKGDGETNRFGYTNFQSDQNMGNSTAYNISPENRSRMIFDSLGMNEKWADILSGSVRMATLFGRKLGAYGYEAQIAGGDSDVSGFARYKGGLFRSNKTVGIEVDERDAAKVDAIVESTIEGARGMARAMGLSEEAINSYTGSIKVNMKGAETAEEQSKRMAEAMDELQFSLLKAAAGGKYSKAEFEKMMEGVRQSIENAGISVEGITGVLTNGIMNGLSGEEIGANLSQMILGGIVQTFAQQAFAPVAQAMMSQIITPIFTAIAAGVPISQAVSKAAMQSMVESARKSMELLNQIFNSEEMKAFFASLNEAFKGAGDAVAGVKIPKIPGIKPIDTTADETKREKEQLERELLRLQGNTAELRRRELLDLKPGNRALQERIWALEDEKEALEKVNELKDAWTGLTDSIEEEIKRLRGLALGESTQALAYVEAQYLIASGQARAMDQDAAAKLPDLSSQLAELYLNTAGSRSEYQARINNLAASLEETNRITRATAGITDEGAQKVKDEALAQQVKLLQQSIDVLTARMEENNKAANITAAALNKASTPAGLRTVPA